MIPSQRGEKPVQGDVRRRKTFYGRSHDVGASFCSFGVRRDFYISRKAHRSEKKLTPEYEKGEADLCTQGELLPYID